MRQKLTKCNFCSYWTGRGCMVTPNYNNCKKASEEYYQHFHGNTRPQKSLRSWDKNK